MLGNLKIASSDFHKKQIILPKSQHYDINMGIDDFSSWHGDQWLLGALRGDCWEGQTVEKANSQTIKCSVNL